MKTKKVEMIEVSDWDALIKETYGMPYSFQQQGGCQPRGLVYIQIPDEADDYENTDMPEIVNYEDERGVSFATWLSRDPKTLLTNNSCKFSLSLWWERNFYPELQTIANDLCEKGLIKKGYYAIEIDW